MGKTRIRICRHSILCTIVLFPLISSSVIAGPPFRTDDPQPVDYLHWEFYIASEQVFMEHESDGTFPHVEINYGALPNIQLHIVAPLGYVHSIAGTHYGYSDTEIGFKYRFVEETETLPQIGFFPLIEIPTGDEKKQLGNGEVQAYLPFWIQKSWGKLTTYGGGGIWFTPGSNRKSWGFAGWEVQYDFSEYVTLGGELNSQTAATQDSEASTSFNLGGIINVNAHHHILFSVGQTLLGEPTMTGYIGYQLTI